MTTAEWVGGRWNVVDRHGRPDSLEPERAFTYNAGAVLFLQVGIEATADHWRYDFENVIGSMPHDAIASLCGSDDPASRPAVAPFIVCPGGRASDLAPADRCPVLDLERLQVDLVNWPELTTSGIDTHFAARIDAGPGQLAASWDSTYTLGYDTRALSLQDTSFTLHPAGSAAGYLNFAHPIAVPLPRWKGPLVGLLRLERVHAGHLPELHLRLRGSRDRHHRLPHRALPVLGRELPVAFPRPRDGPDPVRDEPDRPPAPLSQRRAVLRRVHARPQGPQGQDGADLALEWRRWTASLSLLPSGTQVDKESDMAPEGTREIVFWIADKAVIALSLATVAFVCNHLHVRSRAKMAFRTTTGLLNRG
ncbi:MAG: TonB-dependent receptor [Acidobacteria bacterium]|nr:TonB-dependent receptor [Acidobacteriota bacterium]